LIVALKSDTTRRALLLAELVRTVIKVLTVRRRGQIVRASRSNQTKPSFRVIAGTYRLDFYRHAAAINEALPFDSALTGFLPLASVNDDIAEVTRFVISPAPATVPTHNYAIGNLRFEIRTPPIVVIQ